MKLERKEDGDTVKLINSRRPKMKGRGSEWDVAKVIKVDGERTELWADTNNGEYAYMAPGYASSKLVRRAGVLRQEPSRKNPSNFTWYKLPKDAAKAFDTGTDFLLERGQATA